jgi:dihydroorotate dehydrogenase
MDADSAREKFDAGAQLLQIYTGLIFRGPGLLREIAAALP